MRIVAADFWVTSDGNVDGKDVARIVSQLIKPGISDQEKVLAIWHYMMKHLYHTPGIYEHDGSNAFPSAVSDTMKILHSYGGAICGKNTPVINSLWEAAGFKTRSRNLGYHTVPEVFYNDSWHHLDADFMGYPVKADGRSIASVAELHADQNLLDNIPANGDPHYPFVSVEKRMKNYFGKDASVEAKRGDAYIFKTTLHPINITLREGETLTRNFTPDRKAHYRFWGCGWQDELWGPQRVGPTLAGSPDVPLTPGVHSQHTSRSGLSPCYGNGEWIYEPDLSCSSTLANLYGAGSMKNHSQSPKLRGEADGAYAVFSTQSPYVICGVPPKESKVKEIALKYRENGWTAGAIVSGAAVGKVRMEVSNDFGTTWTCFGEFTNCFEKDVTDLVKGRYSYLVRFTCDKDAGLDSVRLHTYVQLAPKQLPLLHQGHNRIQFHFGNQSVKTFIPRFFGGEGIYKEYILSDRNMVYSRTPPKLHPVKAAKGGGEIVYQLSIPDKLCRLDVGTRIGFDFGSNKPKPQVEVLASVDGGATWQSIGKGGAPDWQKAWQYWLDLSKTLPEPVPAENGELLVKLAVDEGASICDARIYAYYLNPSTSKVEIAYGWEDATGAHEDKQVVSGDEGEYMIRCEEDVKNRFIRFSIPPTGI